MQVYKLINHPKALNMQGRTLNIEECIKILQKKGVKVLGTTVLIPKNASLGNKSLGRLDFLRNKGFLITRENG